jgi:hypothetical protein
MMKTRGMDQLTPHQVEHFIEAGFVKINQAFPASLAQECRKLLWKEMNLKEDEPASWTQPVIRIGEMGQEPFRQAANTPILHRAYDQLAGRGNWLPRITMGSFPIRFPSAIAATDTGWHVDASFPGSDPSNYMEWRVNIYSRGRALLMLFLFSEVGENDAPTRLSPGSHRDVARILRGKGESGLSFMDLARQLEGLEGNEELATGDAGTVYLCHPFMAHAAQPHQGTRPRFLAQPPLLSARPFNLRRRDNNYCPVEKAILAALH